MSDTTPIEEWETVDEEAYPEHNTIAKLCNPDKAIDRCCFYAAVCQVTGFSSKKIREMVSVAIKDPDNQIVSEFIRSCKDFGDFSVGSPLEQTLYDIVSQSDSKTLDLTEIGDIVLSGKDPQVSQLEVNLLTFLLEQNGYFVFISYSISLDKSNLARALKSKDDIKRDTKLILLALVNCHYMFFTVEPCSSARGAIYNKMCGLYNTAFDIARICTSKPSGITTPLKWKLDAAFNL